MCIRLAALRLVALMGCLCLFGGCSASEYDSSAKKSSDPHREVASRPNVILIVIDTLRADHLSCYGYSRQTSPNIDAFAQEADFYKRAYSTSSWTVPSHASIFTGLHPFEHGSHTFQTELKGRAAKAALNLYDGLYPLAQEHVTLAEVLRDEGFRTGGIIANTAYVTPAVNLDQGFDDFIREGLYSDELNELVYAWIAKQSSEPFFLFINYKDVHGPYNTRPRPGFLERPASQESLPLHMLTAQVMPGTQPVPEPLAAIVIDQYDTAIANVDEEIGKLFAWLKEKGLYDDTIIVLTSDHGEAFGEHHLVGHDVDLYEPLIFIPLIVKASGNPDPRVIDEIGSLTDIPGLILDRFPEGTIGDHSSRFPYRPGNHPVLSEIHYSRPFHLVKEWRHRFLRVQFGIVEWPYKFVNSTNGEHLLFDLAEDSEEEMNLFEPNSELAETLLQKIESFKKIRESSRIRSSAPTYEEIDEQTLKDAKSLGYL